VTFSFLVAATMVNEVALVLLFGLFGWQIAAIYLFTRLLIAMLAGWTIGRLHLERYVESWVYASLSEKPLQEARLDWPARLRMRWDAVQNVCAVISADDLITSCYFSDFMLHLNQTILIQNNLEESYASESYFASRDSQVDCS
jgi:uncharacterized membrane protein YraQ (UPF0718 family)